MGSGALGVSLRAGVFLTDLTGLPAALGSLLPVSAVLGGLEAALEPEALRFRAGVPPLEPSFGGALFMAGEDILLSCLVCG